MLQARRKRTASKTRPLRFSDLPPRWRPKQPSQARRGRNDPSLESKARRGACERRALTSPHTTRKGAGSRRKRKGMERGLQRLRWLGLKNRRLWKPGLLAPSAVADDQSEAKSLQEARVTRVTRRCAKAWAQASWITWTDLGRM